MKGFLLRLTSRKFLLTLAGFITAVANEEWVAAVTIVLGYLGVEGANDIINK
jgi:hypothetical protein